MAADQLNQAGGQRNIPSISFRFLLRHSNKIYTFSVKLLTANKFIDKHCVERGYGAKI
jgi:hypothetical protein